MTERTVPRATLLLSVCSAGAGGGHVVGNGQAGRTGRAQIERFKERHLLQLRQNEDHPVLVQIVRFSFRRFRRRGPPWVASDRAATSSGSAKRCLELAGKFRSSCGSQAEPGKAASRCSEHCIRRADSRADCTAGSNRAMRMPMIVITTNSSTKVNPRRAGAMRNAKLVLQAAGMKSPPGRADTPEKSLEEYHKIGPLKGRARGGARFYPGPHRLVPGRAAILLARLVRCVMFDVLGIAPVEQRAAPDGDPTVRQDRTCASACAGGLAGRKSAL